MNRLVLCTIWIGLSAATCPQSSSSEEAAKKDSCSNDDALGHALLATKVTRSKLVSVEPEMVEAVAPAAFPNALQQRTQIVEKLRTAIKQGSASKEQLLSFLDAAEDSLSQSDRQSQVLLALSTGVASNDTQPLDAQETNGEGHPSNSRNPLLVEQPIDTSSTKRRPVLDPADREYIDDTQPDAPMFFPDKPKATRANASVIPDTHDTVEKKHHMALYVVVPISFVFFALFTTSNVMEKYEINAIPESGIMIAVGVVLGIFMKMYAHFDFFDDPDQFAEMNSALLNLILLPIIIFASGWAIRRQDFYSQFPYIMLFAGVGVGISTLVIAGLIHFTGYVGLHGVARWRTAFAYASLISATDPVATLSTYAKLKVDPLLNIMVFGESIINDAVAIVTFGIFNDDTYMTNEKGETLSVWKLVLNLIYGVLKIFGGSALLGTCLGAIYTLIAHWADMRNNKKGQILNIFAASYLTYALAESVAMSGIIAEMFCALLMGIYMRPHLSAGGSMLTTFFVEQVAALADAAICLLIGISVVQLTSKGWYFGLWVMLFCLIGRFFSVYSVALIANWLKTLVGKASGVEEAGWNLLKPSHVFMMWHAGLRGAIALALSLELGEWVDIIDGAGTRRLLQTATFLLICVFLLVFGGSTSFMLKKLGVETGLEYAADHLAKNEDMGPLRGFLKWLDRKILAPVLLGKDGGSGEDVEEMDIEEMLKRTRSTPKTSGESLPRSPRGVERS